MRLGTKFELCRNWSGLLALTSDPHYFGWVSREHCIQTSDRQLLLTRDAELSGPRWQLCICEKYHKCCARAMSFHPIGAILPYRQLQVCQKKQKEAPWHYRNANQFLYLEWFAQVHIAAAHGLVDWWRPIFPLPDEMIWQYETHRRCAVSQELTQGFHCAS